MNLPFDAQEASRLLLAWYGKEGRDLPWRHTRDPYRIWLSEIMLQQTTVAAVIPYYERFLKHFPTLESLASASLDDVITLWAGLGYYSRARNLYSAARQIREEFSGVFPRSIEGLMSLPGIGRSTAGAILSIAFDEPAPILDGNVRRVLVRLFAWPDDPRSSRAEKQLWSWAAALTPDEEPHDYAQAIMDLGATICTPREPVCAECPLQTICQAFAKGLAADLPATRKKTKVPVRRQVALVLASDKGLLLRQRPAQGFLGGLWELPAVDLAEDIDAAQVASRMLADFGFRGELKQVDDIRHAYSHFKLELTVFRAEVKASFFVAESGPMQWFHEEELSGLAVHGAHKKVLATLNLACRDKAL